MKAIQNTRKQKGFTLVELLTVLLIGAAVFMFATQQINRARTASNETQLISEINMLRAGANAYRGTASNYSGVDCAELVTNEYISVPWSNCTGVNPMNGDYEVGEATDPRNLEIVSTGLGTTLCQRAERALARQAMSAACSGESLTVVYEG